MRLFYIGNARIPTEKAHGVTIAKSCEAFARAGASVTLVIPRRLNFSQGDVFSAYSLERNFGVARLPLVDAVWWSGSKAAFFIGSVTFYTSLFFYMIFRSRSIVVYTRDVPVILLSLIGFHVIYECHHLFDRSAATFQACKRAQRIVTISQALKDVFVAAGFDERRIIVAPSGVDLSIFDIPVSKDDARKQLGVTRGSTVAVYTGNFTTMGEDKGLRDTIAALTRMQDVSLFAIGGSEKDIERYSKQAKESGVEDRMTLRGHAQQSELALAQKAADVLLMPFPDTPHYRSHMSPVKMFEYMASGIPIVASDLPTIREVLDERTAYLIAPGNPEAIVDAIERIRRDPQDAALRAKLARADVERYTWDARARSILGFIAA